MAVCGEGRRPKDRAMNIYAMFEKMVATTPEQNEEDYPWTCKLLETPLLSLENTEVVAIEEAYRRSDGDKLLLTHFVARNGPDSPLWIVEFVGFEPEFSRVRDSVMKSFEAFPY